MNTRIAQALAGLILFCLQANSQGASLFLIPTTSVSDVVAGDTVSFDIVMDFTGEPIVGGFFNIAFDANVLQYQSYVFSTNGPQEIDFNIAPLVLDGLLQDASFSNLGGMTGPGTVASVVFTVLPTLGAASTFVMTQATTTADVEFLSLDFITVISPDYNSVEVSGAVPIPAAVWLMISGVAALLGLRRA